MDEVDGMSGNDDRAGVSFEIIKGRFSLFLCNINQLISIQTEYFCIYAIEVGLFQLSFESAVTQL